MIAAPSDCIEIPGWLVREDQSWLVDDAARDGDALTLSAGEFVRQVGGARGLG